MTELQKYIISKLLSGHTLNGDPNHGYRLLSPEKNVSRRIHYSTYNALKPLLRKRGGHFLINKNAVRKLHGKSWVKNQYKLLTKKIAA